MGLGPEQSRARLAELVTRIRTRLGRPPALPPGQAPVPDSGRAVVVVVDPILPLAGTPELTEVLLDGPSAGVFTLCLADRAADLPPQTRAMVTLGGEVNSRLRVDTPNDQPVEGAVADMVSIAWADRFARALAPLKDGADSPSSAHDRTQIARIAPAPALPDEVRLLELLGLELLTPAKLSARWDALRSTRRIVLGSSAEGPLAVEPMHLLVGGDAGSGVSELVRSVVAGQAATNHPAELDLALVSCGPGKPLSVLEELPHVFEYVDASAEGNDGLDRLMRRLEYELDQREWPPDPEPGTVPACRPGSCWPWTTSRPCRPSTPASSRSWRAWPTAASASGCGWCWAPRSSRTPGTARRATRSATARSSRRWRPRSASPPTCAWRCG